MYGEAAAFAAASEDAAVELADPATPPPTQTTSNSWDNFPSSVPHHRRRRYERCSTNAQPSIRRWYRLSARLRARVIVGRSHLRPRLATDTKVSSIPSSDRSGVAGLVSCARGDHNGITRTTDPPRYIPKRNHRCLRDGGSRLLVNGRTIGVMRPVSAAHVETTRPSPARCRNAGADAHHRDRGRPRCQQFREWCRRHRGAERRHVDPAVQVPGGR